MIAKQLCKRCGKLMDKNEIGEHYKWEECVSYLVKTIGKLEDELGDRDNGIETKECKWLYMVDEGYYETKCNQSFYFNDGETLSENIHFKYCPYCGKLIKHDDQYDPSYEGLIPEEEE